MEMGEAHAREGGGLVCGIGVEHGGRVHLAAQQADAGAVLQVNRGVEGEGHGDHFRKLLRIVSPSFWLFSGWNWVPKRLSRPRAAAKGAP